MRKYHLLSLMLVACAGTCAAQQPPAQGSTAEHQPGVTFRTEINFVEVHAIVTDETGAFVRDLTRDDFEILEDGQPQTPAAFSLIDLPIDRPFTPAGGTEPIESDVHSTTRTFNGRIYVLLLDDLDSELDEERAAALCTEVARRGQALVTTAHPRWAERMREAGRVFAVERGEVRAA